MDRDMENRIWNISFEVSQAAAAAVRRETILDALRGVKPGWEDTESAYVVRERIDFYLRDGFDNRMSAAEQVRNLFIRRAKGMVS